MSADRGWTHTGSASGTRRGHAAPAGTRTSSLPPSRSRFCVSVLLPDAACSQRRHRCARGSVHAPATGSPCPAGDNHCWGDLETRLLRTHAWGGGARLQAGGQEKGSASPPSCGSRTQMPRRWSCSLRRLSPPRLGPGWNSTES